MDAHEYLNPSWAMWRAEAAVALNAIGRREEAEEMIDESLGRARRFGAVVPLGAMLRGAARIDRTDRRLELLEESATVLAESSARLEYAHSLIELGGALRRSNRRVDARAALTEGTELATRCGAATLAARARDELAVLGAAPRRRMVSGAESLTASERRIAELAVADMSNPEIAYSLSISRKAVEKHLGSCYLKLDIGSRRELGGALRA
jgi:DNA-binding CsgD family transcriptional regulator